MFDNLPADVLQAAKELELHYNFTSPDTRGASGFTFFARNKVTDREVVIKFYAAAEERRHDEPRLLAQMQSKNVLPVLDARVVSDEWAYFVTPKCTDGDLDDLLKKGISAHEAIDVALQVCSGVSAIHTAGLVHRDLKPANILVQSGVPLIADFGSVRVLTAGCAGVSPSRHCVLYRPPECFGGGLYTPEGDIYQLGLIAYQLMGGKLDYNGPSYFTKAEREAYETIVDPVEQSLFVDRALQRRIKAGELVDYDTLPPWFRRGALPLLRQLLASNPALRPRSCADIAAALLRLRSQIGDWRRDGEIVRREGKTRVIELRPSNRGAFEAFVVTGTRRRRVHGSPRGSLTDLVRRFSQ